MTLVIEARSNPLLSEAARNSDDDDDEGGDADERGRSLGSRLARLTPNGELLSSPLAGCARLKPLTNVLPLCVLRRSSSCGFEWLSGATFELRSDDTAHDWIWPFPLRISDGGLIESSEAGAPEELNSDATVSR